MTIFATHWFDYLTMVIYGAVIVLRWRWLSGAALVGTTLWLGLGWWSMRLAGL